MADTLKAKVHESIESPEFCGYQTNMDSEGCSVFDSASSTHSDCHIPVQNVFPEILESLRIVSPQEFGSAHGAYVGVSGHKYPIVQINGCRHIGPPLDWYGPEPSAESELFIRDIPKHSLEGDIMPHFERFGRVYEFRLMMDYNNSNRGYGYLKFSNEREAQSAMDVMQHFNLPTEFGGKDKSFLIQKSLHKNRLFVGNLPREKSYQDIYDVFKCIFPKMSNLIIQSEGTVNRGFGFLDFPDHQTAVEAKVKCSPGHLRVWEHDIKIVWAHPEKLCDAETSSDTSTLFIRNIGPEVHSNDIRKFIEKSVDNSRDIVQMTPVRDFAFIEFVNRDVAQKAKEILQGKIIKHTAVDIQWARPAASNSIHQLKQRDYNIELRMKCIANYWNIPIYVYGRWFEAQKIQVIGIIIKGQSRTHVFIIEMFYHGITDIHSRVSEVILTLIETHGHLPERHLVLKVTLDMIQTVGFIYFHEAPFFNPSMLVPPTTRIFFSEIYDIALAATTIADLDSGELYKTYERELARNVEFAYIPDVEINGRTLGCAMDLKNRPPLKYNLDNRQMIFALCDTFTGTNFVFLNKAPEETPVQHFFPNGIVSNQTYLKPCCLLNLKFTQSRRYGTSLEKISFGVVSEEMQQIMSILTAS